MANPSTADIKGDTTIIWGTGEGYSSMGHVQRVRDLLTGEEVEISDGDGEAAAAVLFNSRNELEVEFIVKTGDQLPTRGGSIQIGGLASVVTERERAWEAKGAMKCVIKAKRWSFAQ